MQVIAPLAPLIVLHVQVPLFAPSAVQVTLLKIMLAPYAPLSQTAPPVIVLDNVSPAQLPTQCTSLKPKMPVHYATTEQTTVKPVPSTEPPA